MNGSSIVLKCSMSRIIIEVRKNRKWYLPFGYAAAELNNISLHIYQGEVLAIIGELGLLKLYCRIIAGDIKPDRGKINKSVSTYYGDIKTNI